MNTSAKHCLVGFTVVWQISKVYAADEKQGHWWSNRGSTPPPIPLKSLEVVVASLGFYGRDCFWLRSQPLQQVVSCMIHCGAQRGYRRNSRKCFLNCFYWTVSIAKLQCFSENGQKKHCIWCWVWTTFILCVWPSSVKHVNRNFINFQSLTLCRRPQRYRW